MTSTEERARAAMRAIAGTVHDAPPLELAPAEDPAPAPDEVRLGGHGSHRAGRRRPAQRRPRGAARPGRRGRDRSRWSLLAPVAAAVTVAAVAVALVLVRDIPNGRVAAPMPAAPGAGAVTAANAAGVPEYYVEWMEAKTPYLVVGNTLTGQRIATVKSPAGVALTAVYGAATDDRTFIVTSEHVRGVDTGTVWYLLRIAPGTSTPARLTPLPVPVRQAPAGVALSPDGTMLAVALPGSPAALRVYSVATGKLLRAWTTTARGELTAEKPPSGSWQFTASVLRWSADGQRLAFAWNASAIRVLSAAAPDGDLITRSKLLGVIGTGYTVEGSVTCHAAQGWQPVTVTKGAAAGQGVVCGASSQAGSFSGNTATGGKCKLSQLLNIGFDQATANSRGGGAMLFLAPEPECPSQVQLGDGAYIGWANADGSVIIGAQVWAGHERFGIFRGSHFTPLPALPASMTVASGATVGTLAWYQFPAW